MMTAHFTIAAPEFPASAVRAILAFAGDAVPYLDNGRRAYAFDMPLQGDYAAAFTLAMIAAEMGGAELTVSTLGEQRRVIVRPDTFPGDAAARLARAHVEPIPAAA